MVEKRGRRSNRLHTYSGIGRNVGVGNLFLRLGVVMSGTV
jgi:hypothetical protein